MAIPNLTDKPGHWAAPVHESYCQVGTELEFWVSSQGTIYNTNNNNSGQFKLLKGVDVSQPLWAMIDIYGQTSSILLLGQFTLYTTMMCLFVVLPVFLVLHSFVGQTFHTHWQCPKIIGMTIINT